VLKQLDSSVRPAIDIFVEDGLTEATDQYPKLTEQMGTRLKPHPWGFNPFDLLHISHRVSQSFTSMYNLEFKEDGSESTVMGCHWVACAKRIREVLPKLLLMAAIRDRAESADGRHIRVLLFSHAATAWMVARELVGEHIPDFNQVKVAETSYCHIIQCDLTKILLRWQTIGRRLFVRNLLISILRHLFRGRIGLQ
jgi:hypothetical protein